MTRFRVEVELDNGWSRWVQPAADYKIACCDCGLVHNMQFRIEDGRVQFRANRNARSTAAKRRWRNKR